LPEWWNSPAAGFPQFHLNTTVNTNVLRMFTGCESAINWSSVPADWN
jgi:hypothetical protein